MTGDWKAGDRVYGQEQLSDMTLLELANAQLDAKRLRDVYRTALAFQAARGREICLERVRRGSTYRTGDRISIDGEPYVLAQVASHKVVALGMETFNRYNDPVKVDNSECITFKEMKIICGGDTFTLLEGE